jgi:mRNA interferase RelE/StbE
MPHTVEVGRKARKFLVSLSDKKFRDRLQDAGGVLAANPRLPVCLKMQAGDRLCRVRVGDCRIINQIQDAVLTVLVVQIGNRREICRP